MTRYAVHLVPQAPLLLGTTQTIGNYRMSEQVIAGRTFRGAIAAALRREGSSLFDGLFEVPAAEQPRFGPLFPALDDDAAPYPPTAVSCKYHPGSDTPSGHGVFDTLVRQFAFEVVSAPEHSRLPWIIDEHRCPVCGERTEPYQGIIAHARVNKRSTTHVALNRARQVAEEGQLYTREGVDIAHTSGTFYAGWIDLPDTIRIDEFSSTLLALDLYIGGNRSRGMGLAKISSLEPYRSSQPVQDRVKDFNYTLRNMFDFYTAQTGIDYPEYELVVDNRYFTLDLRSDAVLLTHGLADSDPIPHMSDINANVVRRWITWSEIGGWHDAAKLPRRNQAAVHGTYLCCFEGEPDYDALETLESNGIGALREQGFGQLSICIPQHNNTAFD